MAELIEVRAAVTDGRCALWERDPAHPNGEVWVSGPKPVKVAWTALVSAKLRDGELIRVDGAPAAADPVVAPAASVVAPEPEPAAPAAVVIETPVAPDEELDEPVGPSVAADPRQKRRGKVVTQGDPREV